MYRPEIYELRSLELGLEMQTSEIVLAMSLLGWKVSESTLSRLRKGSDLNIDVGGLPFFAVRCLFPNAVATIAQTATWMNRHALSQKLTGDDLEDVLSEVEEQIAQAQNHLDQLRRPVDEEAKIDRALDRASIAEAKGQLAATRKQHRAALDHFLEAYLDLTSFRPHGRMPRWHYCLSGAYARRSAKRGVRLRRSCRARDSRNARRSGLAPLESSSTLQSSFRAALACRGCKAHG